MAARMYTRGWNFFAPPQTVVYHLWSREHRPNFRQVTYERDRRQDRTVDKEGGQAGRKGAHAVREEGSSLQSVLPSRNGLFRFRLLISCEVPVSILLLFVRELPRYSAATFYNSTACCQHAV